MYKYDSVTYEIVPKGCEPTAAVLWSNSAPTVPCGTGWHRPNAQLCETSASRFKMTPDYGKFVLQRCLLTTESLQHYFCAGLLHVGTTMRPSPACPSSWECPSVQRRVYILNCCVFSDVSLHVYLCSSLHLLCGRDASLLCKEPRLTASSPAGSR